MKKFLMFILIALCSASIVYAEDDISAADDWSELSKMQNVWDGQKIITDEQFEKIIKQRTEKSQAKQEKKFKKKYGEALAPQGNIDTNSIQLRKMSEDFPTLLVPKTLSIGETTITPGFYQILAAQSKDGNYYINFYQGNALIGRLHAQETEDDFEADTINFAKIIFTNNDTRAQVVYGCIDYNLVAETGTK